MVAARYSSGNVVRRVHTFHTPAKPQTAKLKVAIRARSIFPPHARVVRFSWPCKLVQRFDQGLGLTGKGMGTVRFYTRRGGRTSA